MSTAAADTAVANPLADTNTGEQIPEISNNEIAESTPSHSKIDESLEKDDPATTAAQENLKHASISDKEPLQSHDVSTATEAEPLATETEVEKRAQMMTPEPPELTAAQDKEMSDHIVSPKKKRVREQDDEVRESADGEIMEDETANSNGSTANVGRVMGFAPVKKRHRDTSADASADIEAISDSKNAPLDPASKAEVTTSEDTESKKDTTKESERTFGGALKPQTSSSAFANSSFGALASSSTSGFGALAGSKPSVFGGGSTAPVSGFGALNSTSSSGTEVSQPKTGFGGLAATPLSGTTSGFGSGSSGFGGASTSAFGGLGGGFSAGFGGGFGGGFSAGTTQKVSTFASSKPDIIGAEKPAKAFGAPESDEENESDVDDDTEGGEASDEEERESVDDRKKAKVSKVPIHDGEEDEATLLQFRAKLFALESKEQGWKERGVGVLKINVHKTCVEFDQYTGQPIPGSFDVSLREDDDGESVIAARLIMRQENTHRVILNTIIVRALKFEEKASNSAMQILFTAFDETKPVNMLLRLSETNARAFMSEIASIQAGLY